MLINQDFTQDRTKYLGGSDIGAILGLSKFRSPLEVWMEKTGKEVKQANSLALRFGTFAESFVASEYALSTNTYLLHDETSYIHPDHPFMSAHIDRFVLGDGKDLPPTKILECKTANPFAQSGWGEVGSDQIPMSYLCQCVWYMAITKLEVADLAVLFGNSDFRIYSIAKDQELEDLIIAKAQHFWSEYVLKDLPPAVQSEADCQTLFKKSDPNKTLEASQETVQLIQRLKIIHSELEVREQDLTQIKQQVMSQMMDAEVLTFEKQVLATWRAPKPSFRLDAKRLEAEHPILWDQYRTPIQNSRRLVFKDLA